MFIKFTLELQHFFLSAKVLPNKDINDLHKWQCTCKHNICAYVSTSISLARHLKGHLRCSLTANIAIFVLFEFTYRCRRFALYTWILRISSIESSQTFSHLKTSGLNEHNDTSDWFFPIPDSLWLVSFLSFLLGEDCLFFCLEDFRFFVGDDFSLNLRWFVVTLDEDSKKGKKTVNTFRAICFGRPDGLS